MKMQHSVTGKGLDLVNPKTGGEFCMENQEEL